MADISAWSPVDESNTAAPPNGWPEYMQNSMVNNCARAMMGAIRRFYDQVISGTLELPYLKLSGGTATGPISATEYRLSGAAFAARDAGVNYHYVFDADGFDPSIMLGGAASGYNNIYRAEHHLFRSNSGGVTFCAIDASGISVATVTANQLTSNGNINAAATVTGNTVTAATTVTGNTVTGNTVTANVSLSSAGSLFVAGTGEINGDLAVAGTVFAHAFTDTDGVLLLDVIAALEARIAALEAA